MVTIDTSLLLGFYQSRTGGAGGSNASTGLLRTAAAKYAPTPPWDVSAKVPRSSALVSQALAGRRFINENAAQLDLPGASADYRKLFALYQGLNALHGLADHAGAKNLPASELRRHSDVFQRGLEEVNGYLETLKLDQIRLTAGVVGDRIKSETPLAGRASAYVTPPLHAGKSVDAVAAFAGDVQFNISVKRANQTYNIAIDLADMGSETRSMVNVVNHINAELKAQGIFSKFAVERLPGEPRKIMVDGKEVETGVAGPDRWALKLKTDYTETMTLSAPVTAPAVYISQTVGDPDPDFDPATDDGKQTQQLLKFQTDGTAPAAKPGETHFVAGRLFSRDLGEGVEAVRASATGPDGSVYVLADVTAASDGQAIKGAQDVALLKYDAAGTLIYSRTLGARETASGMALAVSADGKVAVAGTVTGALQEGESIADAAVADSFVTVFDADGDELWTRRRAARADDTATAVAFGADGSVFVAGQARSSITGATAVGGQDNYLVGFSDTGTAKFATQFGTTGTDKLAGLVVDGASVIVAGSENGRAVVRRYDIPASGAPTLAATRDLGDLQGGSVSGLAIDGGRLVIGGSTRNAALDAGTVTRAHAGGYDAFAASLDLGLAAAGSDAVAYYGGSGDDRAAGMAVSGGKVWLTGQAGADLPGGLAPVGKKDGFVAGLDIGAGTVSWSRRFSGDERFATPTSITVDATGSSVLDRLGLPKGVVNPPQSDLLVSATSLRAGDQFFLRSAEGARPKAVTIEAGDTFDDLVAKVRRALNFTAEVKLVTEGDNKRLQIAPRGDRSTAEIIAGPPGRDALAALGLSQGVVRKTKEIDGKLQPADGNGQIYGLKLPPSMQVDSPEGVKAAVDALAAAMKSIRDAYRDLKIAASPQAAEIKPTPSGPVPAYLKSQLANYQAALSRLSGG